MEIEAPKPMQTSAKKIFLSICLISITSLTYKSLSAEPVNPPKEGPQRVIYTSENRGSSEKFVEIQPFKLVEKNLLSKNLHGLIEMKTSFYLPPSYTADVIMVSGEDGLYSSYSYKYSKLR